MSPSEPVPPEILAIAVALVTVWADEEPEAAGVAKEPDPWRLSGRRWGRPAGYRWS